MSPLGHIAIGFGVRPLAPSAPLWALLLATEIPDLLFFGFEAVGIEYQAATQIDFIEGMQTSSAGFTPWSHGLFMTIIWSILVAVMAAILLRNRRAILFLGLMVFSHWVLGFVVHPPDLALLFGDSPGVGFGLWSSAPGFIISIILELALLAGGIAIYAVARKRAADNVHKLAKVFRSL